MMKWNRFLPKVSPVLRITIGLWLLTISLLLMGDLFGIVPNQNESEIQSRKVMAESLAIQISAEVREKRLSQAVHLLDAIVKRNTQINSIALITVLDKVIMKSSQHDMYWEGQKDDSSTVNYIQVPIYAKAARWGTLEVSFVPLGTIWSNMFTARSFSAMLLFISVFGFIAYWLFLKRALSELDPSSVVPERVRSALDVLNEGLVIIDTQGRIVFVNDAFKEKVHLSEDRLMGKQLSHLSWEDENEEKILGEHSLPWNYLLETKEIPDTKTFRMKTEQDTILTLDISVAPIKVANQKLKGVIVTIDDVTTLERKNKELNHILERLKTSQEEIERQNGKLLQLSTHDPLTNLLNRRALFQSLHQLLREAREQERALSCVILDIDFFKSVNDTYGHSVGDKVIRTFADILQSEVSQDHLVSRYGGEEFVIVFPNTHLNKAVERAEQIRVAVENYDFGKINEGLNVTSSFGVACTEEYQVWEADKLIDLADKALYTAKQTGRNRVIAYNENSEEIDSHAKQMMPSERRQTTVSSIVKQVTTKDKEEDSTHHLGICEDSEYALILDRLTQAQRLAQREKRHLAVLNIFIDTIQMTNNALGHNIARKLKKIASDRLMETFRLSDSVLPSVDTNNAVSLSRVSDSEFISILPSIQNDADITWAVYRMMQVLNIPVEIDGHEIVMTANVGISIYPSDAQEVDALLNHAKMALVDAREKGRGEFLFYNKEMNINAKRALQLESQLHLALERDELYLNFQPIITLETGSIEKVETLLRWKHPELGLVSPDLFVNIAEHAGSIKEIGRWVIEKSCHQLRIWQKNGHPNLKISINLSAIQFYEKNLVDEIVKIVREEGLFPHDIVFELTETALLKKYT